MTFALYGLSCAGKDYLLERMPFFKHLKGSTWLNDQCGGRFRDLGPEVQDKLRRALISHLKTESEPNTIVDGHYAFPKNDGYEIAFTEDDGDCYDVFIYLDTPADVIHSRIALSEKNRKYSELSIEDIQKWRDFEVEGLKAECLKRGKEFILLDNDIDSTVKFMKLLLEGTILTAPQVARKAADRIIAESTNKIILLSDGDKTLTWIDLTKSIELPENSVNEKKMFEGDRYTTYQFWRTHQTHTGLSDIISRMEDAVDKVEFVPEMIDDLGQTDAFRVVISAGFQILWERAIRHTTVFDMAVGSSIETHYNMSQFGKALVARYLREAGYKVIAVGDNMVDYPMLMEADVGYVVAHQKKNASVQKTVSNGTKLRQPSHNQIKFEGVEEVNSIHEDIESRLSE